MISKIYLLLFLLVINCKLYKSQSYTCTLYIRNHVDDIGSSVSSYSNSNSKSDSKSDSSIEICGDTPQNPCVSLQSGRQMCFQLYGYMEYNLHFNLEEGEFMLTDDDLFTVYGANITLSGELKVVLNLVQLSRPLFTISGTGGYLELQGLTFHNSYYGVVSSNTWETLLLVDRCVFENISTLEDASPYIAIYNDFMSLMQTPAIIIQNSIFRNNQFNSSNRSSSEMPGTLVFIQWFSTLITGCTFENNYGFNSLVKTVSGRFVFQSNLFQYNTVVEYGLISFFNTSSYGTVIVQYISDTKFIGNEYPISQTTYSHTVGAISMVSSYIEIQTCQFINNSIPAIVYGNLHSTSTDDEKNLIVGSYFENNTNILVSYVQSEFQFDHCEFQYNSASDNYSIAYYYGGSGSDSSYISRAMFEFTNTNLLLSNSTLDRNYGQIVTTFSRSYFSMENTTLSNNVDFTLVSCDDSNIQIDDNVQFKNNILNEKYGIVHCLSNCVIKQNILGIQCPGEEYTSQETPDIVPHTLSTITKILIGIAIGVIMLILIVALILYLKYRKKKPNLILDHKTSLLNK
ncbi:pectin lyase-like family protein [Tieghemostelium lacteum]|uniref:Pectin lyase-like family protein n=1 Tax=Tieghemostelium lacteum TaxID=361077 RepID=A0A151Z8Q3_TIELA|nr:pectin lyase-like family protein [Tieghemostelium lacteum]|eukprot:KYQ90349.1 pectin lyase-like family protein [Tieghemostelium lacteum]